MIHEIKKTHMDHIQELYRLIHLIAPELDIIETMVDDEKELEKVMDCYMGRNNDYFDSLNYGDVLKKRVTEREE